MEPASPAEAQPALRTGAEPIPQTGEAAWFPPAEDDRAAAPAERSRPKDLRWVFFGSDGLRAGWSILLFLVCFGVLQYAIFRALSLAHLLPRPRRGLPVPAGLTFLFDGTLFAVAAISAFLVSRVERRPFPRYGLGSPARRPGQFAAGLLWGVLMLSLLIGTLRLTHHLVFDGRALPPGESLRWAAAWFAGFLAVGLFEEFLTRGFLQFTLARGIGGIVKALGAGPRVQHVAGFWTAAAFFSVLFGLGHKSNPGESPIGLLSAGLIGVVFAFSLWRTGSLWWAVGFHAAWDWAQSFVYGVADSGTVVQNHLLNSHPTGSALMSGGLTGPEGSIYIVPIILLTAVIVAVTLRPAPGSASQLPAREGGRTR